MYKRNKPSLQWEEYQCCCYFLSCTGRTFCLYFCVYRLKCLGEKEKHVLLVVFDFPTSEQLESWYRKGMFCLKCRMTGNESVGASPEAYSSGHWVHRW